jgi:hypothetical protein
MGEDVVDGDILELAIRILIERAHPEVADALSGHGGFPLSVKKESVMFGNACQETEN